MMTQRPAADHVGGKSHRLAGDDGFDPPADWYLRSRTGYCAAAVGERPKTISASRALTPDASPPQDIIAKDQGLAGNPEHLDHAHRRTPRPVAFVLYPIVPAGMRAATDFSAVEIEHRSVAQVVAHHEREVVDEKVPVEMRAKIIGGGTAAECAC